MAISRKPPHGNGNPITIYRSVDHDRTGSKCTRTAFPSTIFRPTALIRSPETILDFIPQPNQPGNAQGSSISSYSPNARTDEYDQYAARLDHNLSDRHKLSGRWLRNNRHERAAGRAMRTEASPFFLHYRKNYGGGMDLTSALSPTLVSNFKINFIRHEFTIEQYGAFFDITQLGFPVALENQLARQFFPASR